jgi:hypothetical protein
MIKLVQSFLMMVYHCIISVRINNLGLSNNSVTVLDGGTGYDPARYCCNYFSTRMIALRCSSYCTGHSYLATSFKVLYLQNLVLVIQQHLQYQLLTLIVVVIQMFQLLFTVKQTSVGGNTYQNTSLRKLY